MSKHRFLLSEAERRNRTFTESFKRQKVKEIEGKKVKIADISKTYEVSTSAIYDWLNKYGKMASKNKPPKTVISTETDMQELMQLRLKVAELEQFIGKQQILIEFNNAMIDIAEKTYGVDIKKKLGKQQ